jgi:hypothetical protein
LREGCETFGIKNNGVTLELEGMSLTSKRFSTCTTYHEITHLIHGKEHKLRMLVFNVFFPSFLINVFDYTAI